MPDLGTTEDPGNRNPKKPDSSRTARRIIAIAAVVAVHLVGAELVTAVANAAVALTSNVTVSVHGATGQWAPDETSAAAPTTTAHPTTAQPTPTPGQPILTTATAPGTSPTTSSVVDTPLVPEPTSPGEPVPTTRP
ncbi:hypothetical protein [Saccharothrix texasensis]|uniref:hypothetical protein n=1 Tax=Saccharothrix texasensis TaxID=103734 RepID=UPI0011CD9D55|nr:hypothetical protein [Saccharothrix texasensis]